MENSRIYLLTCILVALFTSCNSQQKEKSIKIISPNGAIELIIENKESLLFSQVFNGDTIIDHSPLGLLVNQSNLFEDVSIDKLSKTSFDETWRPVFGKSETVRNNYSETNLSLSSKKPNSLQVNLIVRCYNEGFAYRYSIPEQYGVDSVSIDGELTALNFNHDFNFWAYNGENHNIGPIRWSQIKDITCRIPLVIESSKDVYIGIHEAEIIRYAPFEIQKNTKSEMLHLKVNPSKDKLPIKTSWRTFIVGNEPKDLVNSNVLVNLNEPCKLEDVSWIKPGRSVWDWRVWGYKAADGFEYGLNTQSHFRFIDFASENNIQYLLIDADWYGPEFDQKSDPTSAKKDIDINKCIKYAKQKGVGIILYLNDVGAKRFGLERILKQFSEWGAVGIKYGFMKGNMEQKVRHTRKVVELCAKYHLMANFHDNPVPPSGDERTWPNLITKEFCHAQADAKRSYFPETIVTTTFVNMMTGAIDNCDGWFDFKNSVNRNRVFQHIPGTVAAEVAKLIVVYSGMHVMPDSPEEYLKKDDLFNCIRKMPAKFDSYQVLDGKIGEYIVVARRFEDEYFVGVLTNREAREITLDLGFLLTDKDYEITIYEDKETTHFLDEQDTYKIRTIQANKGSKVKLKLAPGGGTALHFHN